MSETQEQAEAEIHKSLSFSSYCMRYIGFSLVKPNTRSEYWKQKAMFILCMISLSYHIFGDMVNIGLVFSKSPRVEDIVPLLHTFGFATLGFAKVLVLWYKIDAFRDLLIELVEIWPMPPLDEESQAIKDKSLSTLSFAHQCYSLLNIKAVWFYYITPITIYFYQRYWKQQEDASFGFIWNTWYPFDKHEPLGHVVAFIFEIFIGQYCVWVMTSTDLLFTGMTSHIVLLLKLLHRRMEFIGHVHQSDDENYEEIKMNIKLHQRLIKYCNDLENAFSLTNLVNVVFSSVNICCVAFVVLLLEPMIAVSNKLFLLSALLQIGLICWYGDNIFRANVEVSYAAYNSRWYVTNPRCRRALTFLIARAQKPIGFTAMKFMDMNLVTYTSILTRSYSYFALLYTIYNKN